MVNGEALRAYVEPLTLSGEGAGSASIARIASSARVVALGEPTHGQREINILRRRLSERLIEASGFTTVALEAPASRGAVANDWIHDKEMLPGEVPLSLGYWMYATKEYVAFFKWLREVNRQRPPNQRISLVGIDLEHTQSVSWSKRDRLMAENVLRHVRDDERVVLWAHNAHITKDAGWLWNPRQRPMGTVLASRLGDEYVAIGSCAGEGSFLAWLIADGTPSRRAAIPLPTAPPGSLDRMLADITDGEAGILDVRVLPSNLRELLDRPLETRTAGAAVEAPYDLSTSPNVIRCFDAIGFVHHASASSVIGEW